jgi:hypothetical protein
MFLLNCFNDDNLVDLVKVTEQFISGFYSQITDIFFTIDTHSFMVRNQREGESSKEVTKIISITVFCVVYQLIPVGRGGTVLKVHKIENFFGFDLKFVLFLY